MDNKGPSVGGAAKTGGPAGVTGSAKESVTPPFLGGGVQKPTDYTGRNKQGANAFGASENAAINADLTQNEDSLDGARKDEAVAGGYYSGGNNDKAEIDDEGFLQGKGPITTLIIVILLMFTFMFTSSSSNPLIALSENLKSRSGFGSSSAVINKRSSFLMNKLLRTNSGTSFFNDSKFSVNSKLAKKLREQNIEYAETTDANGKKVKMLVYEDADGKRIPVVASDADLAKMKGMGIAEMDVGGNKVRVDMADTITLPDARAKIKDFNTRYNTATLTISGKIAGWFDSAANIMYQRILGKNARNQTSIDGEVTEEKVNEIMYKNKGQDDDGTDSDYKIKEEYDEESGKNKATEDIDLGDGNKIAKGESIDDVEVGNGEFKQKISDINKADDGFKYTDGPDTNSAAATLKAKAQKAALVGSSAVCGVFRAAGVMSMTVGAIQTLNAISFASKYLELADKAKNGDADEVANLVTNDLYTTNTTDEYDLDGNKHTITKSMAESAGFNTFFTDKNLISENDPGAAMLNREYATNLALRNLNGFTSLANVTSAFINATNGVAGFAFCTGAQITAGVIDLASDIALIATTGGIGNIAKAFIKGAMKSVAFSATMAVSMFIVSAIAPLVGQWLAKNLTTLFIGDLGGYAFYSGAQNITNKNLKMSTGKLADADNLMEVYALTKDVEKEWAAYDRATLSPFDTSSKYTFLGSIMNSLAPIVNSSSNNALSPISSIASLAGSSVIAAISPSVDAASSFGLSVASDELCGSLKTARTSGDAMCNAWAGAYVEDLTKTDPDTTKEEMDTYDSFDGEDQYGNPKVKMNSDYAKWIMSCVTNDVQPGTVSATVQGFITKLTNPSESSTLNAALNFGLNFVPLGGAVDVMTGVEEANNYKWNSSLACTGHTGDAALDKEVRTFSNYNLDQRVMNEMGILESNSTVSFLEEYYEENPLDNSYEGMIARFSGLTKDEVIFALETMEYMDYLAEYDPTERYAFGDDGMPEEELRFDENDEVVYTILLNSIEFADVRNRSFVV